MKPTDSATSNNENPKKTDDMVLEVEIEIENEELGESKQEVPQEEAYAATASELRKAKVRVSHSSAEERRQLT
eukprot:5690854-Prorocentrum_lima.AAC.1